MGSGLVLVACTLLGMMQCTLANGWTASGTAKGSWCLTKLRSASMKVCQLQQLLVHMSAHELMLVLDPDFLCTRE